MYETSNKQRMTAKKYYLQVVHKCCYPFAVLGHSRKYLYHSQEVRRHHEILECKSFFHCLPALSGNLQHTARTCLHGRGVFLT